MSGVLDPGDQRVVSRLLNDVNDPSPGVNVSTSQVSGSIIQPYTGMVGKRLVLTAAMAAALSDTAIGTLYEGIYQYVQFNASESTAPARGKLCYWDDYENYIVTTNVGTGNAGSIKLPTTDNSGNFAGVILNAVTSGNYGFIQIAGKASVLFKSATTKTTPFAGDMVIADGTGSDTADVLVQTTALTGALAKTILGVAINTPVGATITFVDLWNLRQVMGGKGGF